MYCIVNVYLTVKLIIVIHW